MRAIASFDVVCEAADALMVEGLEPSTLAVQERIGGGSFTTVKKHLVAWAELRAKAAANATAVPVELLGKAQEFGRSLWAVAVAQAQLDAQRVKDIAEAEVAGLKKELSEASGEIVRLEDVEAKLTGELGCSKEQLRSVELALREAQTTASQVPKLEQALADAQAELTKKAAEAGRMAGELEAARTQLKELKAGLKK